MKVVHLTVFCLLLAVTGFAQSRKEQKRDYVVKIYTDFGIIHAVLFDDTPMHKKNFLKLANSKFYDSLQFHRVLKDFVIQGGDPHTAPSATGKPGMGGPGYLLDAEISPRYTHKKGMIAAARKNDMINPDKKSSGSQFYIVQNEEGAHHLDGEYTVFGRVIKGLEVLDQIAGQPVQPGGMPFEPVRMSMQIVKLKKKQIEKIYGYSYEEDGQQSSRKKFLGIF